MTDPEPPLVSVVFVTYKRVHLLERSFRAFRENTDYPNLQLVISDDGSGSEIQARIRQLPADVLALAPRNRGLGANNNNGLRHCAGKYILMIQDDCICQGPRDYLRNTIQVMEANPDVGIVNYYGSSHPLDTCRALAGSIEPCYLAIRPYENGTKEFFLYTDQPHVMSRAALDVVGYYLEHRDTVECEEDYNRRWRDQTRFSTAIFPAYYNKLYVHTGADHSFRTGLFRYRLDACLRPVANFLKRYCRPLYSAGRAFVRSSVSAMERLRIVR
jgi:glycosyltransferase involved in cell wall biosynthesis